MRIQNSKRLHLKCDQYKGTRFYIQLSLKVMISRNVPNDVENTIEKQMHVSETGNWKTAGL
jgi:hypothetical protein